MELVVKRARYTRTVKSLMHSSILALFFFFSYIIKHRYIWYKSCDIWVHTRHSRNSNRIKFKPLSVRLNRWVFNKYTKHKRNTKPFALCRYSDINLIRFSNTSSVTIYVILLNTGYVYWNRTRSVHNTVRYYNTVSFSTSRIFHRHTYTHTHTQDENVSWSTRIPLWRRRRQISSSYSFNEFWLSN